MKALVTGAGGMLAGALIPALAAAGHEVRGLTRAELDVTDLAAVRDACRAFRPDRVFHLAAFTRVDECETQPDRAWLVNALGARHVAQAAAETGAALLALSTDYVFAGDARRPYREYDPTGPVCIYGAAKLGGEQGVREVHPRPVIVRTSWLFGRGGPNFIDTILARARAGGPLRVVDDQRGAPTWTVDLARGLVALAATGACGTFHCTSRGDCTWHELAAFALARAGIAAPLERSDSAALDRPARRPPYSVLNTSMFEHVTGERLPQWQEGVAGYLASRAADPAAATAEVAARAGANAAAKEER